MDKFKHDNIAIVREQHYKLYEGSFEREWFELV